MHNSIKLDLHLKISGLCLIDLIGLIVFYWHFTSYSDTTSSLLFEWRSRILVACWPTSHWRILISLPLQLFSSLSLAICSQTFYTGWCFFCVVRWTDWLMSLSCKGMIGTELLWLDFPELALLPLPLYNLKQNEFRVIYCYLGKQRLTVSIDPFIDSTTNGSGSQGKMSVVNHVYSRHVSRHFSGPRSDHLILIDWRAAICNCL